MFSIFYVNVQNSFRKIKSEHGGGSMPVIPALVKENQLAFKKTKPYFYKTEIKNLVSYFNFCL